MAVLLVKTVASREEVVLGCERAIHAGVEPGMTMAHARALLGEVPVHAMPFQPAADREALMRLAMWATRYVPAVSPDCGDDPQSLYMPGLLADISGCERLYRSEEDMLNELLQSVRTLGFRARIASASTFGCAWAVARFSSRAVTVIDSEEEHAALIDLPIRALRVDHEIEETLNEIGATTIGHVMNLPRHELPCRFGGELTMRLDQTLGQAIETITPVHPRLPLSVTRHFAGPVKQLEAIDLATRQLMRQLCERLLSRESGLRQLNLKLDRSDCEPVWMELSVSRFTRDARHLWSLLWPKLERAHLGFGVEAVTLTARRVGRLPHLQIDHCVVGCADQRQHVQGEFAQVVDILTNRLGDGAVSRVRPVPTHMPERVEQHVPAMQPLRLRDRITVSVDRPSVLLPKPRPVEVMAITPDGPLVQMQWCGQSLRVLMTVGPERLTPEWWQADRLTDATRDYFKVQDEWGRWWWLYRELETRQWFMHGGWV